MGPDPRVIAHLANSVPGQGHGHGQQSGEPQSTKLVQNPSRMVYLGPKLGPARSRPGQFWPTRRQPRARCFVLFCPPGLLGCPAGVIEPIVAPCRRFDPSEAGSSVRVDQESSESLGSSQGLPGLPRAGSESRGVFEGPENAWKHELEPGSPSGGQFGSRTNFGALRLSRFFGT